MPAATLRLVLGGVAQAATTIWRNPLRASLSALAMAVAVASTAIVQTSLDGLAEAARQTSARAFGSNSFLITRVAAANLSRRELADKLARNGAITRSDVRFLGSVAGNRVVYAATVQRPADVSAGSRTFENATVAGGQATLPLVRDIELAEGRFLTEAEDTAGAQVAILGRAVADELFPDGRALGRSVRMGRRGFVVVGTLVLQGSAGGQSLDRFVWIPLISFERAFGAPASLRGFASAPAGRTDTGAEDHARISMRARRNLTPAAADTFDIVTPEASRSFVERITARLGAAGPPISAMALLAAIVVVTNTTLVSVTQRTREIGIRRAVGAPRASVTIETLAESALVSLAGGGVGLVLAAAAVAAVAGPVGVPLSLTSGVIATSMGAAAFAGIVAGWYPARRAASLDIINAMRQE